MTKPKQQPKLINKHAEAVAEFNKLFCPNATKTIYQKLIREEFNELVEAIEANDVENELKELCDLLYVIYGIAYITDYSVNKNHTEINMICDSMHKYKEKYPETNLCLSVVAAAYIELLTSNYSSLWIDRIVQGIYAYAKLKGWAFDQAFKRVHDSNMSKLENGKPVYREDGKVLKGKNYKPANLKDLINGSKVDDNKKRTKRGVSKPSV